ncbi:helix-turn-helix domain-containing protein [Pseudoruminococcus massiliensis]|uniref:helix-turn-helix domain-containing protein n=1 Tax=Pseudoruminococcus massiliensis TaxID=2086583 RepID=UPI003FD72FE9
MNIEYEKKFGKNIRSLREKANLTQECLSAQMQINGCDITRSALAKIEVGQRHIYPDELKLFKELLNVSFDELFV